MINCCDCKKLGYIEDLIIDECKGCIEALVVPEGGKWCNFFGDGTEYIIPFSCIKRIGPDLILVEIHEEKIGEICLTYVCGKRYTVFEYKDSIMDRKERFR